MNTKSFTLVETMVAVAIFLIISAGILMALSVGRSSWSQEERTIELQQNLRRAMNRIVRELRESGCENADHNPPDSCSAAEYQLSISDNTGENNTDIIDFGLYLACGNTRRWAAPLRWGCKTEACLDEDDNCGTLEYARVEYAVNESGQLVRSVLDPGGALAGEDIIAGDISDFQVSRANDLVTVQISVSGSDVMRRQLTYSLTNQVYLRNLLKD